ncbi:glycosyltransferase [Marinomonas primoryensis]|uniref:Glycosyltransferase_GTB-type superfamily protein n=1 Tax=Marinomonas primoryensis TaxID=178399 RepID=A0A859D4R0_9GAMM|nr:glycosyltransferase [Marinomonas primoryensis]QKK81971.1 Glycosyltransferase_GTB-type superfamily protein [Marinomonas primoryensis]
MKEFKNNAKSFIVKKILFIVRMTPFYINLGYAAKIEILSIIYNEKTGFNDKLHNLETYQDLKSNYRKAINGFEKSKLGKLLCKRARRTKRERRKYAAKNNKVIFLTRSWHFFDPLVQFFEENNMEFFKYDINEFDKVIFEKNRITNKSKYHREKAFKNLAITFRKKQKYNEGNRCFTSDDFNIEYENSDIFFVDWLNHNTNWVLENVSDDKKIIVRIHSYEVLSFFPVTINFGRIDGLIFISEGIKDMFLELWGWLLPNDILIDVLDNIRSKKRISLENEVSTKKRNKTIGMMQYADSVKGFRFAFDVFKGVYKVDPEFKLLLCGKTLAEIDSEENINIQNEIKQLPEGVVQELGYIKDIDSFFRKVGYMLSTSEREGSHESIIEGMAYGCVPIIRNWPILAPFNGAKRAFPMCDIIDRVEEAVVQILSTKSDYENISREYKKESRVFFSDDIPNKYVEFIERVRRDEY